MTLRATGRSSRLGQLLWQNPGIRRSPSHLSGRTGQLGAALLLGRREFVRLAGVASAVAAFDPTALVVTPGDRYSNSRIGVSLVKPTGWQFLSLVDFPAIAQRQRLAINDPDVVQVLRDPSAAPFLVVTKYDAEHPDFNPCITCYDEPTGPGVDTALEGHRQALQAWLHFLKYASVQVNPAPIDLACGTPATLSVWRFSFEHDPGQTWAVQARTLLVNRGDRVHTFHFIDGELGASVAGDELKAAAQSLSYNLI
jgi:hypothetical protein